MQLNANIGNILLYKSKIIKKNKKKVEIILENENNRYYTMTYRIPV